MQIHPPAALLQPAAYALYRLLQGSVRIELDDRQHALAQVGPKIFACRHGELLPLLFAMEPRSLSILVSRSIDGELLASLLRRRGFAILRGSSSRASFAAARELRRALDAGREVGLAADGPRGPRGQVQRGILRLAQHSGAPILPLRRVGGSCWVVGRSWDRFEFPLPGTRCTIEVGPAIEVAAGAQGIERAGRQLARALGGSYVGPAANAPLGALGGYGHP